MNATRLPGSTRAQLAAFFVAALGLVLLFTTCSGPSTNDQSAGLESGGTLVDGPPATTMPDQLGAVDTTNGAYDTTVLPRTDRPGTESPDTESPGTTDETTTTTEEPTATTAAPVTAEAPTTTAAATTTISTTSAVPTTTPATDTTTAPSAPATSDPAVTSSETSAAPTSDTTTPPTSDTGDTTTSTTEVTEVPGTCTNEDFSALVPTGWRADDTCTILTIDILGCSVVAEVTDLHRYASVDPESGNILEPARAGAMLERDLYGRDVRVLRSLPGDNWIAFGDRGILDASDDAGGALG